MYKEFLLAVTVSIDTYIASAAYCNSGIKIPLLSAAVINLICAAVLWISLCLSGIMGHFLSADICRISGMLVMIFIGMLTILKSFARSLAKRVEQKGELSVKLGNTPLAVKLYLDDTAADIDHSKILTAGEAAALALASSLDSAAVGLSCGFSDISPFTASWLTFLCGCAADGAGIVTGKKISSLGRDLSWIGGILIILFAVIG